MGARPRNRPLLTAAQRELLLELARTFGPRLLAYVRAAHGRRLDGEEVVAEALCRAGENIAMLERCARRDLYLLTIARNLCRDVFRRGRATSPLESAAEAAADEASPAGWLVAEEGRAALRAAVARLPENQREVVALRLGTELKFEEIAEMLGLPLGTVLSRMHAAVQSLRTRLGTQV